jgi:hypothetical protein
MSNSIGMNWIPNVTPIDVLSKNQFRSQILEKIRTIFQRAQDIIWKTLFHSVQPLRMMSFNIVGKPIEFTAAISCYSLNADQFLDASFIATQPWNEFYFHSPRFLSGEGKCAESKQTFSPFIKMKRSQQRSTPHADTVSNRLKNFTGVGRSFLGIWSSTIKIFIQSIVWFPFILDHSLYSPLYGTNQIMDHSHV